jgi:CMD domain protein
VSDDIINRFAGIAPGSDLARLREQRPETLAYAQGSFDVLLEPEEPGGVTRIEREAIGLRVATLERFPDIAGFHRDRMRALGVPDAEIDAVELFPGAGVLSTRRAAIMRHTDLLTMDSRRASPEALAELKRVGLTAPDIVTISQLIAYLSYQVRMIALLRVMRGEA